MRSTSIGTQAASPSKRIDCDERRAGFTLIEALVGLALLLAFAGSLGPLMFHSHHILLQGEGQVRAELLLRSLLDTPFARNHPDLGFRDGESGGLRWDLEVEPIFSEALSIQVAPPDPKKPKPPNWSLLRVTAHVFLGAGQIITGQTLRLGNVE